MVVSLAISVPARDLSAVLKCSSTDFRNSLAFSVVGRVDLMLFSIVIHMNLRLSLFDLSHALNADFSSALLLVVIATGFSYSSAISRSRTPR
jgi:hypothetical protein